MYGQPADRKDDDDDHHQFDDPLLVLDRLRARNDSPGCLVPESVKHDRVETNYQNQGEEVTSDEKNNLEIFRIRNAKVATDIVVVAAVAVNIKEVSKEQRKKQG